MKGLDRFFLSVIVLGAALLLSPAACFAIIPTSLSSLSSKDTWNLKTSRHLSSNNMQHQTSDDSSAYSLYTALRNISVDEPILGKAVHTALDVLDNALRLYGPENVYSSFNGGKDAVVIMHLLRASVAKYCRDTGESHSPLLVYFAVVDEFPEVLSYIEETERDFHLNVMRSNSSIVKGLSSIIEERRLSHQGGGWPQHLAFVLGTRQGDPNCGEQVTLHLMVFYMRYISHCIHVLCIVFLQPFLLLDASLHAGQPHYRVELRPGLALPPVLQPLLLLSLRPGIHFLRTNDRYASQSRPAQKPPLCM